MMNSIYSVRVYKHVLYSEQKYMYLHLHMCESYTTCSVEKMIMILIQWFNYFFHVVVPIVIFIYLESVLRSAQLCLSIKFFNFGSIEIVAVAVVITLLIFLYFRYSSSISFSITILHYYNIVYIYKMLSIYSIQVR